MKWFVFLGNKHDKLLIIFKMYRENCNCTKKRSDSVSSYSVKKKQHKKIYKWNDSMWALREEKNSQMSKLWNAYSKKMISKLAEKLVQYIVTSFSIYLICIEYPNVAYVDMKSTATSLPILWHWISSFFCWLFSQFIFTSETFSWSINTTNHEQANNSNDLDLTMQLKSK